MLLVSLQEETGVVTWGTVISDSIYGRKRYDEVFFGKYRKRDTKANTQLFNEYFSVRTRMILILWFVYMYVELGRVEITIIIWVVNYQYNEYFKLWMWKEAPWSNLFSMKIWVWFHSTHHFEYSLLISGSPVDHTNDLW